VGPTYTSFSLTLLALTTEGRSRCTAGVGDDLPEVGALVRAREDAAGAPPVCLRGVRRRRAALSPCRALPPPSRRRETRMHHLPGQREKVPAVWRSVEEAPVVWISGEAHPPVPSVRRFGDGHRSYGSPGRRILPRRQPPAPVLATACGGPGVLDQHACHRTR
jgi:hypothetical protein